MAFQSYYYVISDAFEEQESLMDNSQNMVVSPRLSPFTPPQRRPHYAAGVLPIAWIREDEPVFLVGKDIRCSGICDFGGKVCNRLDKVRDNVFSPHLTASREWYEESLGVSLSAKDILRRLNPSTCIRIEGRTQIGNVYHMYVVEIPFDPLLPRNYEHAVNFLKSKGIWRSHVEKKNVMWVTLDEMTRVHRRRTVFGNTLNLNRDMIERIGRCNQGDWYTLCKANEHSFE